MSSSFKPLLTASYMASMQASGHAVQVDIWMVYRSRLWRWNADDNVWHAIQSPGEIRQKSADAADLDVADHVEQLIRTADMIRGLAA